MKWFYSKRGGFVKMNPWLRDKKHIAVMYTKLKLLTGKEFTERELESYEDILLLQTREGDPIPIAVLSGLAGSGKTTLFDKIAYDWAVGSGQVLQKYKLVFLLKMFALEQGSDLTDAVFDQLLAEDTKMEQNALWSYIKTNPHQVLLLLDGFDEFGSILKILNGKLCRGCTVLVSTRPSHFHRLVTEELVEEPFAHVRVMGFSGENIREYVKKFYSDKPDKAEGLIERIKTSNLLSTLAASPMLLLLMCLLWSDDSTLPETMSRLYLKAFEYIGRRKDVSEDEISRAVISFGKVGLRGLLSPHQTLSFKESDFEPSMLDMALKAGILTKERIVRRLIPHNSVQFIHKTFQEFSTASFLKDMFETNREKFQKTLYEIMSKGPLGFEYLLRFCCGDNEACTLEMMKVFQERFLKDLSLRTDVGCLALHCYFEGQCECLPPEALVHSFVTPSINIAPHHTDYIVSFTYFLKRVTQQTKDSKCNAYLANVKSFSASQFYLMGCLEDLAFVVSAMTNLKSVSLRNCLRGEDSVLVARLFSDFPNLVSLDLSFNDLGGTAALWFKQCKALQELELDHCSLNGDDVTHVAESLSDSPNLVKWNLGGNNLAGTAAFWCGHLKQCKALQKLNLSHCSLNGQDMIHVTESLSDVPNMVRLSLHDSNLDGTAASWCKYLKQCKALEELDLSQCSLNGQDVVHVAEAFSGLPNMVALDLSANNLGGTAATWCKPLKGFVIKPLEYLCLRGCSLNVQDIVHVAELCTDLPNLVTLDLSGNNLGGTAASWCEQLKECKALKTFFVIACHLSENENKHISESLSDLVKENGLEIHFAFV